MSSLQWHILGGNNKYNIGANSGLCTYEYEDENGQPARKVLLFDAGVLPGQPSHPEDPALAGCDIIMADYSRYLYKTKDPSYTPEMPIDSIFLTHNHSDHMAALPLLILMGYKLPKIYATPYTARRLEQELSNAGLEPSEWPAIYTIAPGTAIKEGPVDVTAFWVSHSTPQAVGYFIETPEGNIMNTGDFKLDQSVLWGPAFSEDQFKRIVSKPVDLMLIDSTSADQNSVAVTEQDMRDSLHEIAAKNPGKRLIVAVMGGYEENLASVAKVAVDEGRTLWVEGSAHEQALAAMQDTGMILADHVGGPVDLRILDNGKSAYDLAASKPKDSIVVVTGSQGQSNSALARAAEGRNNALKLNPATDIVVFCAPSMPGQNGSHERMVASLRTKGYQVFTHKDMPLYPQAHAHLPEIIDLVKMADPKHVLPIHGSKKLREICAHVIEKMGRKAVRADNGDVISVSSRGVKSAEPETKGKPPLVGLKTLQGTSWDDRYYIEVDAPQAPAAPANLPAANHNKKHRPRIFNAL